MKAGWFLSVGCVVISAATACGGDSYVDPARVLVVYDSAFSDYDNDGIPDSEAVAWYYVLRRGVPTANLLAVDCSFVVDYDNRYWYDSSEWADFVADLASPIQQKLTDLGPSNIDYVVLCYGIPYRLGIHFDPDIDFAACTASAVADIFNIGDAGGPAADFNPGVPNPYFLNADPITSPGPHFDHGGTGLSDKYLATCLEGDEPFVIFDMVEGCLYGDKYTRNQAGSYRGIAYVDQENEYNPPVTYPSDSGDDWDDASMNINVLRTWMNGFWPFDCEKGVGVIGGVGATSEDVLGRWHSSGLSGDADASAAPDAMFYGAWHHGSFDYNDVFSWLPGSAAAHLMNGPGLDRVRGPFTDPLASDAFLTQALPRGLSAALGRCSWTRAPGQAGYYGEEFRPEIFVYYITHGYNFAESCYASMEYFKCLDMPLGDPIYCPLYTGKTLQDDASCLAPRIMVGDGPQTGAKLFSIESPTMAGGETELYVFKLDVGTAQDSLETLFDYDDCDHYSVYQRYLVTQLADGTPLQSGRVYWYRAHAKDPSGNEWSSAISAFATAGDISGFPGLQTQVIDAASGLDDRYPSSNYPTGLFQNTNPMWLQEYTEDRILYRLDGVSIPSDALILKAALNVYWLFRYNDGTEPTPAYVYAMERDWTAAEVSWTDAATAQPWAKLGISCGGIDSSGPSLLPAERSYFPVSLPLLEGAGTNENSDTPALREIDITGIVREWAAGTTSNYGIVLNNPQDGVGSSLAFFADTAAVGSRPELHIDWIYQPPTVALDAAPQVSGVDVGQTQTVTLTATVTDLPAGRTIQSYDWDFDGDDIVDLNVPTSALSDVQTYDYAPGATPYTAIVTVNDDRTSGSASVQITVTTRPVAVIDVATNYVLVDTPLQFDGSASYDPDGTPIGSYAWDTGGGTPATGSASTLNASWSSVGTPAVTLTVVDTVGGGAIVGTASVTVHVVATAAEMPPGMTADEVNLVVQVTDTGGCLAPYLDVAGTAVPLGTPTTAYEDYAVTVSGLSFQGEGNWTVEMLDASGNSVELSVKIEQDFVP